MITNEPYQVICPCGTKSLFAPLFGKTAPKKAQCRRCGHLNETQPIPADEDNMV